uniref:Uncharacterized protein n=1 Tax=Glossina austeni TaxID=7395 RepID=A0A1A9V104_GLOAU
MVMPRNKYKTASRVFGGGPSPLNVLRTSSFFLSATGDTSLTAPLFQLNKEANVGQGSLPIYKDKMVRPTHQLNNLQVGQLGNESTVTVTGRAVSETSTKITR